MNRVVSTLGWLRCLAKLDAYSCELSVVFEQVGCLTGRRSDPDESTALTQGADHSCHTVIPLLTFVSCSRSPQLREVRKTQAVGFYSPVNTLALISF